MTTYQYDKATAHRGFLIVPFEVTRLSGRPLYSYVLLSGYGSQHQWHKSGNLAGIYAEDIYDVIHHAKVHLDRQDACGGKSGHFSNSYTYLRNLVVIYESADRYYYDHYAPDSLTNIAAPKLFSSKEECIEWVRAGLLRHTIRSVHSAK